VTNTGRNQVLEEEYRVKIREAVAAREAAEAAEAARKDATMLAESCKNDSPSSLQTRARARPQTGIQRGFASGGGRSAGLRGLGKTGSVGDRLAERFLEGNDGGARADPPSPVSASVRRGALSGSLVPTRHTASSRPQTSSGVRRI